MSLGTANEHATGDVVYDTNEANNVYDKWGVGPAPGYATPILRGDRVSNLAVGSTSIGDGGDASGRMPSNINYSGYDLVLPTAKLLTLSPRRIGVAYPGAGPTPHLS